jgi:glucose-1-phosphate thymidylyltransferase
LVYVLVKGVVVVPDSTRSTGPWLGATRALSLQRVANRPIMCHVLDALAEAGAVEIAVSAPPDVAAEVIRCVESDGPSGVTIHPLLDERRAGRGEALRAAAEFVADAPCILHRADGLLGEPVLTAGEQPEQGRARDAVLLVNSAPQAAMLRLVAPAKVQDGHENGASGFAACGVAGACILGPGVMSRLSTPRTTQLLDFAAITEQLARGGASTQVQVARRWRHFAGDAHDLLDMNRAILDTLDCEAVPGPNDGNHFEGKIAIHPSARVTASVIIGPAVIGADASISDSYIGPHTSIGERVRVEGAELERSIVLADASVLHVGSRLVTSIVGHSARVFRDLSMPRALRLQVGEGDEVALC